MTKQRSAPPPSNRLAAMMAAHPELLADLIPQQNSETGRWENNLTDERGNCHESIEYDTEEEAEREIEEVCAWLDRQNSSAE